MRTREKLTFGNSSQIIFIIIVITIIVIIIIVVVIIIINIMIMFNGALYEQTDGMAFDPLLVPY